MVIIMAAAFWFCFGQKGQQIGQSTVAATPTKTAHNQVEVGGIATTASWP